MKEPKLVLPSVVHHGRNLHFSVNHYDLQNLLSIEVGRAGGPQSDFRAVKLRYVIPQ